MEVIGVLVGVRSAHNVGSMFRTADGAGFDKLYLCGTTPVPLDRFGHLRPDISKVALGAERSMPWEYSRSATALIDRLKKAGFVIVALEQAKRAILYSKFKIPNSKVKIALVVGNEVDGLSPAILRRADAILEIPMRGTKESLNVSVAFGIAAYEVTSAREH